MGTDGVQSDGESDDDNSGKLTMSYNMAKNLGLDTRKIEDYFTLTGRRPNDSRSSNSRGGRGGYSNDRNSKRGSWSNNDRSNNDRSNNDRGGYSRSRQGKSSRGDRDGDGDRRYSRW